MLRHHAGCMHLRYHFEIIMSLKKTEITYFSENTGYTIVKFPDWTAIRPTLQR